MKLKFDIGDIIEIPYLITSRKMSKAFKKCRIGEFDSNYVILIPLEGNPHDRCVKIELINKFGVFIASDLKWKKGFLDKLKRYKNNK